jgi:aldehyde dehydrogenase (NAD+)
MGKVASTADIKLLLDRQRNFFDSGRTKDIAFRKEKLETLHAILGENEKKVMDALGHDLSKSAYEGYMTEFGIILADALI